MYSFLRQPRWVLFTLLIPIALIACLLLARWQYHRYENRQAASTARLGALGAPAVPLAALITPGTPVPAAAEWRQVRATGTYDQSAQVLVRRKPLNGENGFWVITPLRLAGPDGGAAVLFVNRGWVGAGSDARRSAPVPAAPAGTVTITGRLRPYQSAIPIPTDVPAGQVLSVDPVSVLGEPGPAAPDTVEPAYVELTSSDPAQAPGLMLLPAPDTGTGPHLYYAIQWVIFGVIFVCGWFVLVRREARERTRPAGPAAAARDSRTSSTAR